MPTTRQRQRDLAIARKGAYETDLLFAEEDIHDVVAAQPLKLTEANVKTQVMTSPGSPVSVASTLDVLPGEIKSIVLPGAWVVVGKGGKPMKNGKMYDEAVVKTLPAKKKKKTRKDDQLKEPEPLLVLEEAASSSTSLRQFERSTTQRKKQLARSKDAKYWASYQHAKQMQRGAVDDLVAALMLADGAAEDEAAARVPTPSLKPTNNKDNQANSSKDKARRRARSAAAEARCCIWLDDELSTVPVSIESDAKKPPSPWVKVQMSGELQLCFSSKLMPEPTPPGAWTTVGKRGKAMSNFPPLAPTGKAEPKRRESPPAEPAPDKPLAQKSAGKPAKGLQCSVM